MDPEKRYQELASKWLNNTISQDEKKEFAAWYNANQENEVLIPEFLADNEEEHKQRILNKISQAVSFNDKQARRRVVPLWWAAAAALFAVLLVGIYLSGQVGWDERAEVSLTHDVAPGGDKATLTLANGKTIFLDQAEEGEIANEHGVIISKNEEGQLLYILQEATANNKNASQYNIIKTPRGGQYQIVLPDGSRVWLNAASSLEFPVVFANNERRVKLTGEGYFEIVKHTSKSFIVETSEQEITVLGTHFNINAYEEEQLTKTTLIEGSVSIKHREGDQPTVLKPGQQAQTAYSNKCINLYNVDVSEISAWKNGYFHFKDTDIYSIMRQFSRWYDIEVVYETAQPKDVYVGKIPRTALLSEALQVLETVGIKFKIEGKKLFVLN